LWHRAPRAFAWCRGEHAEESAASLAFASRAVTVEQAKHATKHVLGGLSTTPDKDKDKAGGGGKSGASGSADE